MITALQQFSVAGVLRLNGDAMRARVHPSFEFMRFDGGELLTQWSPQPLRRDTPGLLTPEHLARGFLTP